MEEHYPLRRSHMPPEVAKAYELMKASEIPGFPGKTGADTCYIITTEETFADEE